MAKHDGEEGCAYLVKQGICDVAVSDDWDILLYGCPVVWRHFLSKKSEEINLELFLKNLKITYEKFVELGIY